MTPAVYLVDTSALARLAGKAADFPEWERAVENGLIAICPITELEFLYSARSEAHRERMVALLNRLFLPVPPSERYTARAWEIQRILTEQGEHRCAGPVDLLVAATAEVSGLTLLHYDRDFDTIGRHTGQSTRWLADPGSL